MIPYNLKVGAPTAGGGLREGGGLNTCACDHIQPGGFNRFACDHIRFDQCCLGPSGSDLTLLFCIRPNTPLLHPT